MKRMACVLALAAGAGIGLSAASQVALADPTTATVASGLKLTIVPPTAATAGDAVAMDVNFRGSRIRSVEILVDGVSVYTRTINTPETRGVLQLTLPASLFTEGSHQIVVQAIEADGSTASASAPIRIAAPEVDALAQFVGLRRNASVLGDLPVTVKLDSTLKDCYVIFFLDDQFLSARNYAPYTYSLDTTKYPNGAHTVKVAVYNENVSVIKTLTSGINIKNPGGPTNRETMPHDLRPIKPVESILPDVDIATALAAPGANADILDPGIGLARDPVAIGVHDARTPPRTTHIVANTPAPSALGDVADVVVGLDNRPGSLSRTDTVGDPIGMRAFEPGAASPVRLETGFTAPDARRPNPVTPRIVSVPMPGLFSSPMDTVAINQSATDHSLDRTPLTPIQSGNMARRPRMAMGQPIAAHVVAHTMSGSTANLHAKTFDVAFDNTRIAFDVPPRVENGLPLAPFRAIFEHGGGTVKWFNESKTVRAVNSTREIEIHIGNRDARVNDHTVKMEATPYIDRGRTIVPLSFVKDAMDVKVEFDAKTGHMLIESNR